MTGTFNIKTLGFSINIQNPTKFKGTPTTKNIVNSFDLQANIVGLERLSNESNADFKNRIIDSYVHRSGPSYIGVVNGLSRAFGFVRIPALTIDLKRNSAGEALSSSPRVEFLANKIVLYNYWKSIEEYTIDKEIYTYQSSHSGFYISDFSDEINSSDYFSCVVEPGIRPNAFSSCLIRYNSDYNVDKQYIRSDYKNYLGFTNIVPDSIIFSEKTIFRTQMPDNNLVSAGQYYLDYSTGELYSYSLPSGNGYCSFKSQIFPMIIDYSPVQLFSLQDDNFKTELFDKITLESGEEINSLPNHEGSQIFHQLFKETEMFWGK